MIAACTRFFTPSRSRDGERRHNVPGDQHPIGEREGPPRPLYIGIRQRGAAGPAEELEQVDNAIRDVFEV